MDVLDQRKVEKIRKLLKKRSGGITITDLAADMDMNRNLVAKYLDMLVISGQVEKQSVGTAKVFCLSGNIPVSALFEYSSDLVIMLDRDNRITRVNERLLEVLQEKRENLVGKKIGETKNPFIDNVPLSVPQHNPGIIPGLTREMTSTIDNEIRYFTLRQIPTVFEGGSHGSTVIIEDITADKKYHEILGMSESRFHGIVDDMTEFVIRFHADRTLSFVNTAVCRMLNKNPEELTGRSFMTLIPDNDNPILDKCLSSLKPEHPAGTVELHLIDTSGRLRWFCWSVRALFDETGDLKQYQAIGTDITEKREMSATLSQYVTYIHFLHRKAWEFVELPLNADIYDVIGRGVRELLPDAIVFTSSYDKSSGFWTIEGCLGEKEREVFRKHQGSDWVGMRFGIINEMGKSSAMSGRLIKIPGDLYFAIHNQVPEPACKKIEEELDIGDLYVVGLSIHEDVPALLTIMLRKGDTIKHPDLLEAYSRLATLALVKWNAERELVACKTKSRGTADLPAPS
jgi:PAS domain S-box-containing protein